MWYEILPAMAVVMAGIGLPQYAIVYFHNLYFNNPLHRGLGKSLERRFFLRDERLTDNPWAAGDAGLENIPDD